MHANFQDAKRFLKIYFTSCTLPSRVRRHPTATCKIYFQCTSQRCGDVVHEVRLTTVNRSWLCARAPRATSVLTQKFAALRQTFIAPPSSKPDQSSSLRCFTPETSDSDYLPLRRRLHATEEFPSTDPTTAFGAL